MDKYYKTNIKTFVNSNNKECNDNKFKITKKNNKKLINKKINNNNKQLINNNININKELINYKNIIDDSIFCQIKLDMKGIMSGTPKNFRLLPGIYLAQIYLYIDINNSSNVLSLNSLGFLKNSTENNKLLYNDIIDGLFIKNSSGLSLGISGILNIEKEQDIWCYYSIIIGNIVNDINIKSNIKFICIK